MVESYRPDSHTVYTFGGDHRRFTFFGGYLCENGRRVYRDDQPVLCEQSADLKYAAWEFLGVVSRCALCRMVFTHKGGECGCPMLYRSTVVTSTRYDRLKYQRASAGY